MRSDSHATLMDATYRWQRYIYDFTRKYYLFGRDRLIKDLGAVPEEAIVEVGCGTGRNLIKIAHRYPETHLYGLDASEEMLKTARRAVEQAGLSDRIRLVRGLAEDLTPVAFGRRAPFDHVVFSYSLSMIPDWKQALRRGAAAAEAGKIHVVDFGSMEGLGWPFASVLSLWLRIFHVTPRKEILQRLESHLSLEEQTNHLRILPAHYAFIWQGGSKTVQSLAL